MEKIIFAVIIALVGVLIWYLKAQTKRQNIREDKRDERDIKREEKILNIVDVSLVNVEKAVRKDSENTEKVERTMNGLKDVITNHLVSSIDKLTTEVRKLNGKK
ncbi:hypothetical protein ES708_17720 [subsurface metagenome]